MYYVCRLHAGFQAEDLISNSLILYVKYILNLRYYNNKEIRVFLTQTNLLFAINVMRKLLYILVCSIYLLGLSQRVKSQIINTIAGNGTGTYSGDGIATANSLHNPTTCVVDLAGNVYIADWGNNRIRKVTPAGIMTTIAGTGTAGHTGDGLPATAATLNQPNGMGIDLAGNLYVAEQGNNDVRKITTSGIITTVAGTGGPGYSGDGAIATNATMRTTSGVAIDPSGVLYIADWGNNVIRKVDASGIITTIAGNGTGGYGGDGGPATAAICKLNHPYSVSLDLLNNLYISDENNQRLRVINLTTGIISLVAGTGGTGSTGDGGQATAATFNLPDGIVATAGDLYIADANNNKIRKVHLATGIITTIAGTGTAGSTGDGFPATAALLHTPSGVELDAAGNVYISDFNNHKIREIVNGNHLPRFDSGRTQKFTMCENSFDSINALLPVVDSDIGQTLTWILYTAPLHGVIYSGGSSVGGGGTMYTATSTGLSVLPVGLAYVPTIGYSGKDSFVVRVNDGISVDSTKIIVTINPLPNPGPIAGPSSVCVGSPITLTDDSTGGVWSATNTNATVGSTGIVTGVTAGLDTIKYTITNSCGTAFVSKVVSVNAIPGAIAPPGPVSVCLGGTSLLTDPTSGGTWSASNGNATVSGGLVTGVIPGTDTIYYTVAGCAVFKVVTVNAAIAPIAPTNPMVCVGTTITLSDATGGGTWSASNGHATITGGGLVTGVSSGVDTITYTVGTCFATTTATVAAFSAIAPSTSSICEGATETLTDAGTTGVWTASNAHATVGFGSGVVTGVTAGADTITYTIYNGATPACSATATVNVTTTPAAITPSGPVSICLGTSTLLADVTGGGVWSSSNSTVAAVGTTGNVTGAGLGTATISYTIGSCFAIKNVTVISTPAAIAPSSSEVCQGSSISLTDGTSGGTWTSGNVTIATVGSTGSVTGVGAGVTTITYTVGSCFVTGTVTVDLTPAAISPLGPISICTGTSTSLTDATAGGTWSSSNTLVATVGSSGTVTGAGPGIVTIFYTVGTCSATKTLTVVSTPAAIAPASLMVCTGSNGSFTDGTSGGVWSSANTLVATVSSGSGLVSGISVGSTIITYSIGTCFVAAPVTVNAMPAGITPPGPITVCPGTVITFADVTSGGVWSSGSPAIATVGSVSGTVTAISTGIATISYTVSGCSATKNVTVTGTPASIVPAAPAICIGNTITLTDASSGGVWSSSNTGVATIGSGTGAVTTVAPGTTTITYTIGLCFVTTTLTVNDVPAAIVPPGAISVCIAGTITLTDASPGGTWSSGATGIATVGAGSGIVTGVSTGTANITYTNSSGCFATKPLTVNITPSAISPVSSVVCVGSTNTLTDLVGGGVWTSSNIAVAAIGSSSGIISGIAAGTVTITYAIGSCSAFATVTVNPLPVVTGIGGPSNVCVSGSISLTDGTIGGVWSSSNPAMATVGSTGTVIGVSGGVVTISYTITNSCGSISATHTVNVVPAGVLPITGLSLICAGTFTTFTDATPGGVWSASNATATVSGTGLVTGISSGTDTIRYTVTNVCGTSSITKVITIGPYLTAGTIFGGSSLCAGSTITLTDLAPAGVWSASNGHATVSVSGVVTGMSGGGDTIMYTVTSSCGSAVASHPVTVNPLPDAGTITGPAIICAGMVVPYTDAAPGGVWSLTNILATISGTGVVTAISTGTDTIKYTVTNSCGTASTSKIITIGAFLTAGSISGPGTVCAGSNITLTDPATGGVWSTSNSHASVSAGIVTGVSGGVDTILYTMTSACGSVAATHPVTVNPLPDAGSITGPSSICTGTFTLFADLSPGGTWSISNAHATITGGGSVTAVSTGTDTISYTVTNSCGTATTTKIITIGAAMSAGTISGPSSVCIGSVITLTDGVGGGVWSSGATGVADIGSSSGIVTGITAGTASITYTVSGSCGTATATTSVTVSSVPVAGTIIGPASLCVGTLSLFTDAAPGGIWISSNSSASVSSGGVVSGIFPGSDTISYSVTNGCGSASASLEVAIISSPGAGIISGPGSVCTGASVTLADGVFGGLWSASNSSAMVGSTGIVTGLTAGVDTIIYTVSSSCGTAMATHIVAVISTSGIGVITGPDNVCVGSLIALSESTPGGAWGTSNPHATITTGGLVTGITPGIDTITYSISGACGTFFATKIITINAIPVVSPIGGSAPVCVGATVLLTDAGTGGFWSTTNANATVGSASGIVTGVFAGIDTVVYTVSSGCGAISTSTVITINPLPFAGTIIGSDSLCIGTTISLTDLTPGGTWSAGNANATVSGGIVTGISLGTDPVSYSVTNSCGTASALKIVTIVSFPVSGVISGSSGVCVGTGITLFDAAPGGTWLASNANASIVGPGIIDGVTVGVDTIFYVVTNICGTVTSSKIVNVNPVPVVTPITGLTTQCVTTTISLFDAVSGGVWLSSDPSVATIGIGTGVATGVSVGTTTITYTVTNGFGCPTSVTIIDTVVAVPVLPAITGSSNACIGATTTLSDAMAGGTWSSSDVSVATIGAGTGIITGVAAGTVTITYTVINPCGTSFVTRTETVDPMPVVAAITGITHQCESAATALSDATTGGVWTSDNTSIATVGSSGGVVTGVAAGITTINYFYTSPFGCTVGLFIADTVVASPVVIPISGTPNECVGATATLSDATAGGVWSSSDVTIATVSSGTVTGVAMGSVSINYSVTNGAGCTTIVSAVDTVNNVPVVAAISGATNVCVGATTMLTVATPGGAWSVSNGNAFVSTGGIVTGIIAGLDTISYSVTNGCGSAFATAVVAIGSAISTTGIITGSSSVCKTASITLSDTTSGGTWSASNAKATVTGAGVVTGVTAGLDTIRYTVSNVCGSASAVKVISINQAPSAGIITGGADVCIGGTLALYATGGTPGGTWNSSNISTATVSAGGVVTGVNTGSATISYTVNGSCGSRTATLGVNVLTPAQCRTQVGAVNGTDEIKIFPNPASTILNIDAAVQVIVTVMSIDGKVLIRQNNATIINVSGLAGGMYLVMIYDEQNALLKAAKFVKE